MLFRTTGASRTYFSSRTPLATCRGQSEWPGNMSKPSYRTPAKAQNVGGIEWRAIFSALFVFLVVNIAVTQRLAAYFRYQPVLGKPLIILTRLPIYEPFHWAFWAIRFSSSPYPQVQSALRLAVVAVFAGLLFSVLLSVALIAPNALAIERL